ncbi:MAG: glycosyl transferase family protein [Pelagimonas sp.]|jgi:anthranilate phosphoribosyltransferase|nr:glycosyl transferase family protein [Pelagimonas sp.]
MSLSDHVRTLGRGPGRSRSLTREEAADAMRIMLSGRAAPEAIGALLMLLRTKGETPDEIAGLAGAAQADLGGVPPVDLDWPCYAAGRSRGLPWFLLAAKLVAARGHRVLIHGWNGTNPAVRDALSLLGIACAETPDDIDKALARGGIAYAPLETLHPALFALLNLRDVLGLRSCINTVSRMLNPASAPASVQGVFHPTYRGLQAEAARLLGWSNLTVIKGGGGEFERHPGKPVSAFGLRAGQAWDAVLPALCDDTRRLSDLDLPMQALAQLWQADQAPPFARHLTMGTAALALHTLGDTADPQTLWAERPKLELPDRSAI